MEIRSFSVCRYYTIRAYGGDQYAPTHGRLLYLGEVLGHTLKSIGMSLGISSNLESVTAQYVDVSLERKKSVLDIYHKALHPPKGDVEKKQGDGGKEEKPKKKVVI